MKKSSETNHLFRLVSASVVLQLLLSPIMPAVQMAVAKPIKQAAPATSNDGGASENLDSSVTRLESKVFGKSSSTLSLKVRLEALESSVFGSVQSGGLMTRIKALSDAVGSAKGPQGDAQVKQKEQPSGDVQSASSNLVPDDQSCGVTDKEIVLGSCSALSGQMSYRGLEVVKGGQAYFSYINDQGGINGRKIRLVSGDDRYTADGADQCFYSFLKGKVFLATLFNSTVPAARYVPKADVARLPMVGFSTGADFIVTPAHKYVFQVRASYGDEAAAQVDVLLNKLHRNRIALVYQNDAYGAACQSAVVHALQTHSQSPCVEVSYPRLTTDVGPIIAKLKEVKPDAVIMGASASALPLLVRRRDEIGTDVQIVGFSPGTDLVVKEAGKAADGMLISQVLPYTNKDLATYKLFSSLIQKYAHAEPTDSSFEGFVIAMVVVDALKRAGRNLNRERLLKSLESMNNVDFGLGPNARLSFSHDQHAGLKGIVFWSTIDDGKVVPVSNWAKFVKH